MKGWLLMNSGKPTEGRESFQFAMRIDPRSALDVMVRSHIVETYYMERDYENAVVAARRLVADRPDHPWAYRWLAAALGQLGPERRSSGCTGQGDRGRSGRFHLFVRQRVPWMRQVDYDHMLDGLRRPDGRVDVTAAAHQQSAATIETETMSGAMPRGVSSVARPTSRSRLANIASCLSPTRRCLPDADDAQARQRREHGGVCLGRMRNRHGTAPPREVCRMSHIPYRRSAAGRLRHADGPRRAQTKVLRVVPHADLTLLDPVFAAILITREYGLMVYEELFAWDTKLQPKPQMVESWSASPDGLTWRFTLRESLKFHDGQAVTTADVIPSLRRWMGRDLVGAKLLACGLDRSGRSEDVRTEAE